MLINKINYNVLKSVTLHIAINHSLFSSIISLNHYSNVQQLLWYLYYRWENWDLKLGIELAKPSTLIGTHVRTTKLASLNKTTTLELKIKNLWKAVRYSIILYYVCNSLTVHELVTVSNLHNNNVNKNRCVGCKSLCGWIQTGGENYKFD